MFLVPEIALTPQTLERVNAWFAGRVALLHSKQTPRQKFDQWWDIRGGAFDVVVGPRSALFAPAENLGLIVIDEEHEWTYKQEETPPLYHARAAALELARRTGAVVVLGSATPSVESYYHASRGRVRLLSLPRRVTGGQGESGAAAAPSLATVQVCDMRRELREGNRHIFSRALSTALRECLDGGNQAILFLNRRGTSSIVQCRDCGYVAACRRCATSLTYHARPPRLLCHQCNYSRRSLTSCPDCRGRRIRQLGLGTERVVAEVSDLFPGVRVDRLDSDALRQSQGGRGGAGAAEEAVARLASGETQVLVGTQMIAKGLDVPNVALVGVVLADIGLHVPDFRAGERAFSLLCQVAGRAGRGDAPGRVFIQTYDPEHYAIRARGQPGLPRNVPAGNRVPPASRLPALQPVGPHRLPEPRRRRHPAPGHSHRRRTETPRRGRRPHRHRGQRPGPRPAATPAGPQPLAPAPAGPQPGRVPRRHRLPRRLHRGHRPRPRNINALPSPEGREYGPSYFPRPPGEG